MAVMILPEFVDEKSYVTGKNTNVSFKSIENTGGLAKALMGIEYEEIKYVHDRKSIKLRYGGRGKK